MSEEFSLPNPPASPLPIQPDNLAMLWIGLALLLVSAIIFLIFRKKTSPPPPLPDPRKVASQSLRQLESQLPHQTPQETATNLSEIFRRYLVEVFDDPALYETTEEFLLRPDKLASLPQGTQDKLQPYLLELADLKYRPNENNAPHALSINKARKILQGIDSTRKRQVG